MVVAFAAIAEPIDASATVQNRNASFIFGPHLIMPLRHAHGQFAESVGAVNPQRRKVFYLSAMRAGVYSYFGRTRVRRYWLPGAPVRTTPTIGAIGGSSSSRLSSGA